MLSNAVAQQKGDTTEAPGKIYISATGQFGFLWSHRYNMGHLVKKHLGAFEITAWKPTCGDQCWHEPYNNPQTGLAFNYIPLGNPDQLGDAYGLYPFINYPLSSREKNPRLNLRLGWGIGWITKPFDPIENHKNIAIGTHVNTCFALKLNTLYKVNKLMYLESGIGITHFSNGAFRLPNLGINLPMVNLGLHWLIHEKKNSGPVVADERMQHTESLVNDRKWHFSALFVAGANDINPPGGNKFAVTNMITYMMKQTARKHRFGGGIDLMYSQALRHILLYDSVNVSVAGNLQPGVKFCYELVMGRLSYPMEMGVYLYSRYKENGPVYNRWGLRYLATDHLLLNLSLKTHFAKAEYWEVGAGWRF
ncbi:MAG: acyloxyacyl hydrolase [Bacteroidia bacterium]